MSSFLKRPVDYDRHNAEVRQIRDAFYAGHPVRPLFLPVGSITNFFQNPDLNTDGYTYEQFFTDPQIQIDAQLRYQYWCRHNLYCDAEMGLPDKWQLAVDFQNSYDASWTGAPLVDNGQNLPDTLPMLSEHKEALYDMPELLPVNSGLIGRGFEFMDYMEDYCREHTFMDRPVLPPARFIGEGTDGVLDLAYKLRGAENLLVDMLEDEEYFSDLMEWLTKNLINRISVLRGMHERKWGIRPHGFYYADDAICLISHPMYREYVLPYEKRIIDAFRDGEKISMHICGGNMHHFGGLVQELPIRYFDTGFPIDFDRLRELVGPEVCISGGPSVMLVRDGSEEEVRRETLRVLNSRSAKEGPFILIAANNTAPCTPVENIAAMYDVLREKAENGFYRE